MPRLKNTIFKRLNLKSTTAPASTIYKSRRGYHYIDLELSKPVAEAYRKRGIQPLYNRGVYFIRVRVNIKTKLFLDGEPIYSIDDSPFDALSSDDLLLSYATLDTYSQRMQETYQCNCYAKSIFLKRR